MPAGEPADAPLVEIRVQGIGNLPWTDALGRARNRVLRRRVRTVDPPRLPRHRVRIVNWVRGTRRAQRAGWYLAFPFTLVNVTAFLHPAGRRSRWLAAGTTLISALLTVGTLIWGVAMVETVLARLPVTVEPGAAAWWVSLPVAVLIAGAVVLRRVRAGRRDDAGTADRRDRPGRQSAGAAVTAVHAGLALAAGVALAITRPARWAVTGPWPDSPGVVSPASASLGASGPARLLDPLPTVAALSVIVAAVFAAVLVVRAALAQRRGTTTDARATGGPRGLRPSGPAGLNLATAGLLLVVAVVVLHALFALLRMVADSAASLVAQAFAPGGGASGTWVGVVLAADDPTTYQDNRVDFLPAHALLLLVVLVASALGVAAWRSRRLDEPVRSPYRWRELARRSVLDAGAVLWRSAAVAGVAGTALSWAGIAFLESRRAQPVFPVLYLLVSVLATLVAVAVLLAQFAGVREAVNRVGDVSGFWPVRSHPLAGSSYRADVMAALRAELAAHRDRPVVLVGHSQGSLLCLWLLATTTAEARAGATPALVTTGSPVHTVFRGLFPAHVDERLLRAGADRTAAWLNAFRVTDPVSGPMPGAENVELADPVPPDPVRGHGDYWDDPTLAAWIARFPEHPPRGLH
ncbi:hypothetical protein GCM10011512_14690 [Tersicoccus solisilvae]|uniref:Integral membrane protein n=1 Tax=Tersicoccus solisilvae TaxID=1882339 RepID=A0ABQ1P4K1_9MICC|nr:DUF3089 domain-containing protein [Tersicoccus solisilvae]GGC88772.1 hypothetical protein GCM10011512_14690 [Tersicoccus solisilvae]